MADQPLFKIRAADGRPVFRAFDGFRQVFHEWKWRGRFRAVQRAFLKEIAKQVLAQVKTMIVGGGLYRQYRRSLKVGEVPGAQAVVIHSQQRRRRITQDHAEGTIIIVNPLPRQSPTQRKPFVDVLMNFGPWTIDTIPVTPLPREAKVIFRQVGKKEADLVRVKCKKEMPIVLQRLNEVGVKAKKPVSVAGVDDVAFLAMRMEFGIGGQRLQQHWRPALRLMKKKFLKQWQSKSPGQQKRWAEWLMDPKFKGWRGGGQRMPMVARKIAEQGAAFARKIRV